MATLVEVKKPDMRKSEGGGGAGWAWNVSDASLDAFAGWSDAGSGAEESKKKKGIRDVMGLTLVGSLFAAGVAFTTLVYINKNLSGTKNRVDPSKEFTTSYDTRTEGDQVSNDFDVILTEKDGMTSNFHEDNETGTSKDLPLKYVSGDISESSYDYVQKLESTLLENVRSVGGSLSLNDVEMVKDADQNNFLQSPITDCTNCPVVPDISEQVLLEKLVKSDLDIIEEQMLEYDSVSVSKGHNLGASGFSAAYSVPLSTYVCQKKQPNSECDNEIDRSSFIKPLLPEKSFSLSGIPAPLDPAVQQVLPGKVLVPAIIDQVQGQALAALQVLKIIEVDAQQGDICSRREYARWLVSASNVFARSAFSKVYPAMYIENVTELAFDDVTPEDPDFPSIQGLAEAGLISSKLSKQGSVNKCDDCNLFSPECPVSRQDLVSWKLALEKRQLLKVDKNKLYQSTGYIDIDKINPDAWPALLADFSAGEQGITALAFGYTRLFQPEKPVTKAQAAIAIATGDAAEVVGEELARIEAESLAEIAVNAHTDLVSQVEKDINASFEKELARERQKTKALEKLAEEARLELDRLRKQKEEEKYALQRSHAAVESEMEFIARLKHEVEEQLESLISKKLEMASERDRMNQLHKELESENQVIARLQYELEVERKALSMTRITDPMLTALPNCIEEEAKRAREHMRALEEARQRWERHGIKVIVDGDLQDDASIITTWLTAAEQPPVNEAIGRGENLRMKLKEMAAEMKLRSSLVIDKISQKILALISALKLQVAKASEQVIKIQNAGVSKAAVMMNDLKENASGINTVIGHRARRVVEDCKGSVGKITQKFKA
ncbi:hypothetical protein ZIOFF_014318 [Zingiber officinale]|uniref:Uncharacterized protein n=1 Tax=Zingiber officinale TaxID=94328 RepID=A0A8J5HPX7_ZINOF|nr:hypothetical protein ZIOFF_014318 [Zingiber officinale]